MKSQLKQNPKTSWSRSVSQNNKSISGQLAIDQYNKGNYYESVVSIVEGYRSSIYRDNIVATGLGYNISMQSRETNSAITKAMGMSPTDQASFAALSHNFNPSPSLIPNTSISPEQATKAAQVMRDRNFQPVAIAALEKLEEAHGTNSSRTNKP